MNERTIQLIGEEAFCCLQKSYVVVAGLGGVGGHCVEALARAGIGRLHLVDYDTVQISNLNRQLVATKKTLGMKKTEAMRRRIEEVSDCRVSLCDVRIDHETIEHVIPEDADYIVDAIDQLSGKLALILFAQTHNIPILSCMGAGNRRDASRFYITDIYQTSGDPLARNLRGNLRRKGVERLEVVFSDETGSKRSAQGVIGSLAPVTGTAGLLAASHVIARLSCSAH